MGLRLGEGADPQGPRRGHQLRRVFPSSGRADSRCRQAEGVSPEGGGVQARETRRRGAAGAFPGTRPHDPGAKRTPFTPEVLAQAEKRLASYVGPLARLLIKDAVGKSGNLKQLYAELASHIDEEDERRDFLASIPFEAPRRA